MISIVENRDCMEAMAEFPDKFFDLAVVDPPYGIGESGGAKRTRGSKKTNGVRKEWDVSPPSGRYFTELKRVSVEQIIWGGNYFGLPATKCFLIWDKLDYGSDFADCEYAWASFKTAAKIYKQSRQSNQSRIGFPRFHPTQKPVALYDWIYKNYLPNGGKVLDTHLGSGSNRIAADKAGNIDFWGYELDKDYYEAQEKRWANYKAQLNLFRA